MFSSQQTRQLHFKIQIYVVMARFVELAELDTFRVWIQALFQILGYLYCLSCECVNSWRWDQTKSWLPNKMFTPWMKQKTDILKKAVCCKVRLGWGCYWGLNKEFQKTRIIIFFYFRADLVQKWKLPSTWSSVRGQHIVLMDFRLRQRFVKDSSL